MLLHQQQPVVCQSQYISSHLCDSNSSSGASSQHPSPITSPQKFDSNLLMNCAAVTSALPLNLSQLHDSGIGSSLDSSPTHFIPRQQQWDSLQQPDQQQFPSIYPLPQMPYQPTLYAPPSYSTMNPLIHYLPQHQQPATLYTTGQQTHLAAWNQMALAQAAQAAAASSYVYPHPNTAASPNLFPTTLATNTELQDRLPAGYQIMNFGSHVPNFDLIKWYSEKPPFILDGNTTSLYKMREIDRRCPSIHHLTMDMEYNTVIAEYFVLRNVFGVDYQVEKNVFIKLNRTKDGELARYIHLFFRDADDAEVYLKNAERFGSQPVQRTNPRAFSKHNVYITTMPYHLLNKDQLCNFICNQAIQRRAANIAEVIKRARVDVEKQSALVEFHRPEDASATCRYFYEHVKQANARPAFEKVSDNNSSHQSASCEDDKTAVNTQEQ